MEFKENKNNYYTKELNDIDRYLLRIIKRYFDLEEINNAASINAIISEAITRYKASIIYDQAPVTSLNNKVGVTNINITELEGEKAFDKKSAFNKDFGNLPDTICEGNDFRLSDRRTPTEHHHKINNVNDLKETIEDLRKELKYYAYHLHTNMAILNKLTYTGTRTQIDLVELESLGSIVISLAGLLDSKRIGLESYYSVNKKAIENLLKQIDLFFKKIDNYIFIANEKLNKALAEYVKQSTDKLESNFKDDIENLPVIGNWTNIANAIENTLLLIATQEIDFKDIISSVADIVNSNVGTSVLNMFNNSTAISVSKVDTFSHIVTEYNSTSKNDKWETNGSMINSKVNQTDFLMLLSTEAYELYTHEVTLTSDATTGNTISIILAASEGFYGTNKYTYPLALNVTLNNSEPYNMCVVLGYQTEFYQEICYDPTFVFNNNWENKYIRIRITRDRTKFKIYRSDINSEDINPVPCMEFDLNQIPNGSLYIGKSKYGYGCYSQTNSKFYNINFEGFKEVVVTTNKDIRTSLDISVLPSNCITSSIEIEPELVYNNEVVKIPYIANDFAINAGVADGKLYAKFQLLEADAEIPLEVAASKIRYNIYSRMAM